MPDQNTDAAEPEYKCDRDIENPNRCRRFRRNPDTGEYNIPAGWVDCSACTDFLP
jgi:hypothetical protein